MRKRPQVVHEAREHPRLLQDRVDLRFIAGIDAIEHPLEPALQHGERIAELVRDVGHQMAPLHVLRFEPRRHAVERARQRAHPARTVLGGADREVALRHAVCRFDHLAQRKSETPHQAPEDGEQHEEPHHPEEDSRRPRENLAVPAWKQPRDDGGEPNANQKQDDGEQAADAPVESRAVPAPRSAARRPWLVERPPGRRSSHSANL